MRQLEFGAGYFYVIVKEPADDGTLANGKGRMKIPTPVRRIYALELAKQLTPRPIQWW